MSKWTPHLVGLNMPIGGFLNKYRHVFDVFTHPVKRNVCCKLSHKMMDLMEEERELIKGMEAENVVRVKKLLLMSVTGSLRLHALRLVKREMGLPDDFRETVLGKCPDFEMDGLEVVSLVDRDGVDDGLKVAQVEKWREKEFTDKWLSEFETKYAFPIDFLTGFRIQAGFRGKLKEWQRLPYVKPYEKKEGFQRLTCERFEKRAVGILHEFLSLTVEKMVELQRLAHFRRDFGIPVNVREVILKHPGIFYISTRGTSQMVFLREAYCKDCLVSPNPVYEVRRKMLNLILLATRNTRELRSPKQVKESIGDQNRAGEIEDDFVISILDKFVDNDDDDNENTQNREGTSDGDYVFPGPNNSDDDDDSRKG